MARSPRFASRKESNADFELEMLQYFLSKPAWVDFGAQDECPDSTVLEEGERVLGVFGRKAGIFGKYS